MTNRSVEDETVQTANDLSSASSQDKVHPVDVTAVSFIPGDLSHIVEPGLRIDLASI